MKASNLRIQWTHLKEGSEGCYKATICKVIDEKEAVIGFGKSNRNVKHDNWDRNVGRKISLTRALSDANLSKETRTDIWMEYFSIPNRK